MISIKTEMSQAGPEFVAKARDVLMRLLESIPNLKVEVLGALMCKGRPQAPFIKRRCHSLEQQLELDRRKIRKRISDIRDELKIVSVERQNQRKRRVRLV